jgi:hypothetical protein
LGNRERFAKLSTGHDGKESSMRVAFVSTYPPIECGIGTYTSFLIEALARLPNEIHIISQNGAKKTALPARFLMQLLRLHPMLPIFSMNSAYMVNWTVLPYLN